MNRTGKTAAAGRVLTTVATAYLWLAATGGWAAEPAPRAGLACELFGDADLKRGSRVGAAPDLTPIDKTSSDWSIRFTGMLKPPVAGEYAFRAEADTGLRVKIDNVLVIDGWAGDAARTGKTTLAKDKPILIVVEYFFNRGRGGKKAELRLFWTRRPAARKRRRPWRGLRRSAWWTPSCCTSR